MQKSLKKRAAELEHRVKERAEEMKRVLKEYRDEMRRTPNVARKNPHPANRAAIIRKRRDVERINAEYIKLQKELDLLYNSIQARK